MPAMPNGKPRILLVRGGQHWQLQTAIRNPDGKSYALHNIATVAELGSEPPYALADATLREHHGIRDVTWLPGMPEDTAARLPAMPDLPGAWHADY